MSYYSSYDDTYYGYDDSDWDAQRALVEECLSWMKPDGEGGYRLGDKTRHALVRTEKLCSDETEEEAALRRIYIYGTQDVGRMMTAAREGLVALQPLFDAYAFQGSLEGLDAVYAQAQEKGEALSLAQAQAFASGREEILGETCGPHAAVLRRLFEWGADANHDGGALYKAAMMANQSDIYSLYMEFGGDAQHVFDAIEQLRGGYHSNEIRQAMRGHAQYGRIDDATLAEYKQLQGLRPSLLKTIFNFETRCVTRMVEDASAIVHVENASFNDYDADVLKRLRARLERLGGHPPEADALWGKPALKARRP